MFAVADALDALTTDRPYRPAVGFPRGPRGDPRGSGTQFDPSVVAAYDTIPDEEFARLRDGVR